VVGAPANRANVAPLGALDASSHVAAGDEGSICLLHVAHFACFVRSAARPLLGILLLIVLVLVFFVFLNCHFVGAPAALQVSFIVSCALNSSVYYWHVFEVVDVGGFDLKHGRSDFQVVPDFYLVELRLLSFSGKTQPGAVCASNICEQKTSLTRCIGNFGVEVAHLGVFLDTKSVVGVSADCEAQLVHADYSVPGRSLKDMQLNHGLL